MNPRSTILAAASLVLAAGCSASANPSGAGRAQMSVSAKAAAAGVSASAAAPGGVPAEGTSLDLGNGISLDRVRVVVRKLKLEGALASESAPGAPCVRDDSPDGRSDLEHEHDDEAEPVVGPFLVDVSGAALAAGGVAQAFDGAVPPGSFHELKFVIGPVTAAEAGSDPKLTELAAAGASLIVDGSVATAEGRVPFTFTSSLKAQIEREGRFVVADGQGNNITLTLGPAGWFGGASALLDPRDPANRAAIEARIKASIAAFEDDDCDGHDDDASEDAEEPESDHACTTPAPAACTYTYSGWSPCTGGSQSRTVVGATPADCTGTPGPLSQACGER